MPLRAALWSRYLPAVTISPSSKGQVLLLLPLPEWICVTFFKHRTRHVDADAFFEKHKSLEVQILSRTSVKHIAQSLPKPQGSWEEMLTTMPSVQGWTWLWSLRCIQESSGVKFHSDEMFPCVGSLEEGSASRGESCGMDKCFCQPLRFHFRLFCGKWKVDCR